MPLNKLSFILALFALVVSDGVHAGVTSNKAFAPKSKLNVDTNTHALLKIRGGSGSLDPMMVAKAVNGLGFAQGMVSALAPEKSLEGYGLPDSPILRWMFRFLGVGAVSQAVTFYCLLVKQMSLPDAFALGLIPGIVENLRNVLTGDHVKVGFSREGQLMALLLNSAVALGSTQDWGPTAMKALSTLWASNGIVMILRPQTACKLWGQESDVGEAMAICVKSFGFYLFASYGSMLLMLFKDTAPLTAYGYAMVIYLIDCVSSLAMGESDKLGTPKGPMILWSFLGAVAAGTILL